VNGRWFVGGVAGGVLAGVGVFAVTSGVFAAGGLLAADAPSASVPRFVEETRTAGIEHRYEGDFEYFVGGGVAVLDCDDDGIQDLYVAGGSTPAALYRNVSDVGGALRFEEVPGAATDLTGVTGAYPLDVDGDGLLDLAVLRVGENALLRGTGDCTFERANERWGLDGGAEWTAGFSATWERGDALPTLAFANYLDYPLAADNSRSCAPTALVRASSRGDGYDPPLPLAPGFCALSALFHDWDGTGRHDLRLTNDRHYFSQGGDQLWRVEAGQPPALWTAAEGWEPLTIWGMGIAAQDLTGDGRPEVVLTSQGDNKLQSLEPDAAGPTYADIAIERGTTAHRPFVGDDTLPSTAWHPEFADVNNDGRLDLFISKGNVEVQSDHAAQDPSNLLLAQADGSFTEAAREAGIVSLGRSRGAALADLNLDGMLDLVEVQRREPVRVWRNVGSGTAAAPEPMGGWAAVRLSQPGSNRDAVGAWLDVTVDGTTVSRQVVVGGGHAGGQIGWVHLGLGDADEAVVRVRWPDGEDGPAVRVPTGTFGTIERGSEELTVSDAAG
jgi:hypothetical protein